MKNLLDDPNSKEFQEEFFKQSLQELFDLAKPKVVTNEDGTKYLYVRNFFKNPNELFNKLKEDIKWEQKHLKIYGKQIPFPRLVSWYADKKDMTYSFSGIEMQPNEWNGILTHIKKVIYEKLPNYLNEYFDFNSVLLNRYRDGSDSISWHSDDEDDLGENPMIISCTFGETRTFKLRNKKTKEIINLELESGSLLIMFNGLNDKWEHSIPKSKKVTGERINLTFRTIK